MIVLSIPIKLYNSLLYFLNETIKEFKFSIGGLKICFGTICIESLKYNLPKQWLLLSTGVLVSKFSIFKLI